MYKQIESICLHVSVPVHSFDFAQFLKTCAINICSSSRSSSAIAAHSCVAVLVNDNPQPAFTATARQRWQQQKYTHIIEMVLCWVWLNTIWLSCSMLICVSIENYTRIEKKNKNKSIHTQMWTPNAKHTQADERSFYDTDINVFFFC